jgi:signal peptidase I
MKRTLLSIWETLEVILIAVGTVFLIRSFLIQPFVVSGASMEPNFSDGNYLLVDEVTYRFREPERGEVVVFRYPLNKDLFFIKRIVGMPGEEVSYDHGSIKITGPEGTSIITESYLASENGAVDFFSPVRLGKDQYFVLGDNRSKSFDSRIWGALDRKDIIGIARLRVFPLNEFQIFNTPTYQE